MDGDHPVIFYYGLLAAVICAAALRLFKTTWVYFLVSSFLPPMLFIAVTSIARGSIDPLAHVAFLVAWAIAFAIAVAVYLFWRFAIKPS